MPKTKEKIKIPRIAKIAAYLGYNKLTADEKKELRPYITKVGWKQEHNQWGPAWLETNIPKWDPILERMSTFYIKVDKNWVTTYKAEGLAKTLKVPFTY